MKRHIKKYLEIYNTISDQVAAGTLLPGSRLPGIGVLARQYGVAPVTIERAMKDLVHAGIVEVRSRSGTYIRDHRVFKNILLTGLKLDDMEEYLMGARIFADMAQTRCLAVPAVAVTSDFLRQNAIDGAIWFGTEDPESINRLEVAGIPLTGAAWEPEMIGDAVLLHQYTLFKELSRMLLRHANYPLFVTSGENTTGVLRGFQHAVGDSRYDRVLVALPGELAARLSAKIMEGAFDSVILTTSQLTRAALTAGLDRMITVAGVTERADDVLRFEQRAILARIDAFGAGRTAYEQLVELAASHPKHCRYFCRYIVPEEFVPQTHTPMIASGIQPEYVLIHGLHSDILEHPYYGIFLRHLHALAQEAGAILRVERTGLPLLSLRNNLNPALTKLSSEGIFLLPMYHPGLAPELEAMELPWVGLSDSFPANFVALDYRLPELVHILEDSGYSHIALLTVFDPNTPWHGGCGSATEMSVAEAVASADAIVVLDDFLARNEQSQLQYAAERGTMILIYGRKNIDCPARFHWIALDPVQHAECAWEMMRKRQGLKNVPAIQIKVDLPEIQHKTGKDDL